MTGIAARPLGARLSRIRSAFLLPSLLVAFACGSASAQAAAPAEPVSNSSLDSLLFYQLLIGELELSAGRVGNAYGVILDAARRHGDEVLFQRAVEIALQARAGDQALDAVRAWRGAKPKCEDRSSAGSPVGGMIGGLLGGRRKKTEDCDPT